jgi:26S proteasome regulatory subunit N2
MRPSNCRKWIQFLTIADVGAIHLDHLKDALFILSPFLSEAAPPYATGGGLSTLGLIHATYFWDNRVLERVTRTIRTTTNLVVQHGGCLALDLIAMESHE